MLGDGGDEVVSFGDIDCASTPITALPASEALETAFVTDEISGTPIKEQRGWFR